MDANELAKKPKMALPGFTTLTPKSEPNGQSEPGGRAETEYDQKIQEELEKRMADCCDGFRRHVYDDYGYKPRHVKNPSHDSPAKPETSPPVPAPNPEPQRALQTDKKNSKR